MTKNHKWTREEIEKIVKKDLRRHMKGFIDMKYVNYDVLVNAVVDRFLDCCGYSFKEFRKKNRKVLNCIVKELSKDDVRAIKDDYNLFREYCYETAGWKWVDVGCIVFKGEAPVGFADDYDQFFILDILFDFWKALSKYILKRYKKM